MHNKKISSSAAFGIKIIMTNFQLLAFISSATAFCSPLKNESCRSGIAMLTSLNGSFPFKSELMMYTILVFSGSLQLKQQQLFLNLHQPGYYLSIMKIEYPQ
jgi:hypothetical protein